MRTTIDLDEDLVQEVMKLLEVDTKKEAVHRSLRDIVKRKRRARLRSRLGTMDLDLSLKELEEMRKRKNVKR